jgi:succinate dehydrogenase/fumarate reductase flavoprotein subunit
MHKFLATTDFIGSVGSADDFLDAIIVGSGLAGLTAALNILDRGDKVVIMEKEHLLGGNNHLGGNSLLECTMLHTIVGRKLPIRALSLVSDPVDTNAKSVTEFRDVSMTEFRDVSMTELQKHSN